MATSETIPVNHLSLVGIAPIDAFRMGVEWSAVKQRLRSKKAFTETITTMNADNIRKLLRSNKRKFRMVKNKNAYRLEAAPATAK